MGSRTGNKIHCPGHLMTVFIVNGFFVTEKSAGTLWLRDVVHLSCSHSHFIRSARTTPMTRSLWPEAQRVLFIAIKSASPNVSASSLAEWRQCQAKSSSCTQTQPFRHQCVSGRPRREAHCARWLIRTRQQACTQCNHFG